jgi:ABC-type transport system involved in multi-copper enzyme maturation permease subunit
VNMRLINAELLKLRKRRGLFWGSLFLAIGLPLIVFIIIEILHLAKPAQHGPVGGTSSYSNWLQGLYFAGAITATIVGAIAGTADVAAGVFRDLVATGRSRWQLFTARVVGALVFFIPIITLGYILITLITVSFAGSGRIPAASIMARGYGWILICTGFDLIVALGFASLIGSRAAALGVLLGWQFIASPLLLRLKFLGSLRQALFTSAIGRLDPVTTLEGPLARSVTHSAAAAALVLVIWVVVSLALGAWRTVIQDV